jgi:hypothetical protein
VSSERGRREEERKKDEDGRWGEVVKREKERKKEK